MGSRAPWSQVLFGNITTWGPQASDYIEAKGDQFDAMMLVEHHQRGEGLKAMKLTLKSFGFVTVASEANFTDRSAAGTHGGAMLAFRSHLQLSHVPPELALQAPGLLPSVGYDWAAAEWHLKGLRVCMLAAYFDCGANTSGPNAAKFKEIASYIKSRGHWFVMAADWNMTPDEVEAAGWPSLLDADIVGAADVALTCTGRSGRTIDFLLVPRKLLPIREVPRRRSDTPWKSHIDLSCRDFQQPRSISIFITIDSM